MELNKFMRLANRICDWREENNGDHSCDDSCPIYTEYGCMLGSMWCMTKEGTAAVVAKMEEWEKGHPAKTRLSEFLKVFPNVTLNDDGFPIEGCPADFDYTHSCEGFDSEDECNKCVKSFWLEEIE